MLRKSVRVAAVLVAAAALLALVGLGILAAMKPAQRPASTEKIAATPSQLQRGEYLVRHVADCLHCHSALDGERFTAPAVAGTEGQGGFPFDEKLGIPGVVQAQNITPDVETGIGGWTDGEVLRAVREGVKKDGTALFPQMPYTAYHEMSDEDAQAIVAYLRTLKPIRHEIAERKLDFPVNLLVKLSPRPLEGPVHTPSDHLAYGKYLVTIAGCAECHTPMDDHGNRLHDHEFAGSWEMKLPFGRVVTANLTPAPGTWMSEATREEFIGRFKAFEGMPPDKATPGRNTVMGWYEYAGMTEDDLGAIYDFLKTVPAVGGVVNSFPDAPDMRAAVAQH